MPVKLKGALSFLGKKSLKGKTPSRPSGNGFKPLDFHWVFYKIDNFDEGCLRSPKLLAGNLEIEANVFGWLRLNSQVMKDKRAVGLKFN